MQNRILLIEPPFYRLFKDTYSLDRYPLSLGYLSGMIKKKTDWGVMSYNADFNLYRNKIESFQVNYLATTGFYNYINNLKDLSNPIWRRIESIISEYKPAVVGISAKSGNFTSVCIVAKLAKAINVNTIVIVGGPHPTMVGADVLDCPDIDICVRGEGEQTIVELLKAIDTQKELDSVKGIVYRKNGGIIENAPRELIEDLDSLYFPHENASEVLKDYAVYPISAFGYIFATRGCPYDCFFCGSRKIWSREVRFRSPDSVIREIKCLQNKGLQFIHFDDDIFGVHKQYINELCNAIITHCPNLKWSCEFNVKLVDEGIISLMKRAGCCIMQLGIESGNNEILKKIRKGITVEDALLACKIIRKYGIELQTFFMVGFPWETEKTINDTVAVMKKTNSSSLIYSIFTPYPGSEAFEFCKKNGLIDDNYDPSLYNHQSPLNHFCINISPERFRVLVYRIERMVDRLNFLRVNRIRRIRQLLSLSNFRKVQKFGLKESVKRVTQILISK